MCQVHVYCHYNMKSPKQALPPNPHPHSCNCHIFTLHNTSHVTRDGCNGIHGMKGTLTITCHLIWMGQCSMHRFQISSCKSKLSKELYGLKPQCNVIVLCACETYKNFKCKCNTTIEVIFLVFDDGYQILVKMPPIVNNVLLRFSWIA